MEGDTVGTKPVSKCTNPGIPVPASDALTDVLREGARRMLREAVEAEVQEFLTRHAPLKDGNNRQRVERNGY
jgi:putative transposase